MFEKNEPINELYHEYELMFVHILSSFRGITQWFTVCPDGLGRRLQLPFVWMAVALIAIGMLTFVSMDSKEATTNSKTHPNFIKCQFFLGKMGVELLL